MENPTYAVPALRQWTLGVLAVLGLASAAAADPVPPAPDYAQPDTWAAWPGRPSGADAIAPGLIDASLPAAERVDVFFIHPTTYLTGSAPNARYDEPGSTSTQIDRGVLRSQASVFNGCCRIYAPHYRQAHLHAFFGNDDAASAQAFEIAYSDVRRAFDYYLAHENHGRPFIIASHSQGSLHAMRLLQERIAGKPLQQQLVAAYAIGYAIPLDIERTGLPICRAATQTGCLIDWNTVKDGASDRGRENTRLIWTVAGYQRAAGRTMFCVNPLNWSLGGSAAADLNLGALPGVRPGMDLEEPVVALTGATCSGGDLRIDIPFARRRGFSDALTLVGSYHIFDYNVFYTNIRVNARDRIRAWRENAAH
ncbi:MAG: DUF3089 domain-containing protein [Proteobacteria bacterium]|nr:DUF3089 domain-containing protein [Pseudomonadota bacterium]